MPYKSLDAKRAYAKRWRACNATKIAAYNRAWRLAHPELVKAHRKPNPARQRGYRLRHFYGITQTQFDSILRQQKNACAICHASTDKYVVDHDHECCPGRKTCGQCIRGLLCDSCNRALGGYETIRRYSDVEAYIDRRIII